MTNDQVHVPPYLQALGYGERAAIQKLSARELIPSRLLKYRFAHLARLKPIS
jgi:hypothetical protein